MYFKTHLKPFIITFVMLFITSISTITTIYAQSEGDAAVGAVRPPLRIPQTSSALQDFIPTGYSLAFFIGALMLLAYLLYGGIKWILAGGDKIGYQSAKMTITYAVLGFILLSLSYAIATIFDSVSSYRAFPEATSSVSVHICGDPRSGGTPSCIGVNNTLDASLYNSLPVSKKRSLCTSLEQCNAGCVQNDRLKEYRYCRPY